MRIYKDEKYVDVLVVYKRIKNLYIRVRDNEIKVTCSRYFTYEKIEELILKKFDKYYSMISKKNDMMSFLGKTYKKEEIESNKNEIIILDNIIKVFYKSNPKRVIEDFYKRECKKVLDKWYPALEEKFKKYNISCKGFKVGCFKSIWGSCNNKTGIIKINAFLLRYDLVYLECICHHEYSHFKYQNHQKEYHRFYDMVYPNNRIYERNLKKLPSY